MTEDATPAGRRIRVKHLWVGQKVTVVKTDGATITGTILGCGRSALRLRDDAGKFHEMHPQFSVRSIHEA